MTIFHCSCEHIECLSQTKNCILNKDFKLMPKTEAAIGNLSNEAPGSATKPGLTEAETE